MSVPANANAVALFACSACGGDYEDPENSASSEDGEEVEEAGREDGATEARPAPAGEFPVHGE